MMGFPKKMRMAPCRASIPLPFRRLQGSLVRHATADVRGHGVPRGERATVRAQRVRAQRMASLPRWVELEPVLPAVIAAMRRYRRQIGCVLRPGSVGGADLGLRSFAGFLAETTPQVTSVADIVRRRCLRRPAGVRHPHGDRGFNSNELLPYLD